MSNIKATEEKIKRLEGIITEYQSRLARINSTQDNWEKQLKDLQDQYNLTAAEILETKSELLRLQINDRKTQSGIYNRMPDDRI